MYLLPYHTKKLVESEVVKALQKEEYTLNSTNCYGENLLHISAANGCIEIMKEILRKDNAKQIIDRKNKFGWTPLMLAIRNRDVETVEFLLQKNASTNESTYLGMSVLGLAAAINDDMFEIVYKTQPSALLNAANDDITPLCIAAMKNDKKLFLKLLDLGFDVSNASEYTQIMMKQSTVPEIANVIQKRLDTEDYWYDTSDNIPTENDLEIPYNIENKCDYNDKETDMPSVSLPLKPTLVFTCANSTEKNEILNFTDNSKPDDTNLLCGSTKLAEHSAISPTLTCALDAVMPSTPNEFSVQNDFDIKKNNVVKNEAKNQQWIEDEIKMLSLKSNSNSSSLTLQRLQSVRPSNIEIQYSPEYTNFVLEYTPRFSPLRSPQVPSHINDENVFGENTPTPPHYKTPPRGMLLNSEDAKMFVLLKRYGLSQYVCLFIEQEVDIDLFMTLTDDDLKEIGVENEKDRKDLLAIITDFNKSDNNDTI